MFDRTPYRSSKSRLTKQEEVHLKADELITNYFSSLKEPVIAEDTWFYLKTNGALMSITSFNKRLKKLVEAGIVKKIAKGYNKFEYSINQ